MDAIACVSFPLDLAALQKPNSWMTARACSPLIAQIVHWDSGLAAGLFATNALRIEVR